MTMVVDRTEYDIRVSVLPSFYGEKVVMRLAAANALSRKKSELGLRDWEMKQFDHILSYPNGILLVTGPTGSGKSTTLYTALSELNHRGRQHPSQSRTPWRRTSPASIRFRSTPRRT